jgi:hypothetical protein
MGVPVKFRHSLDSAHTLVRYKTRLLLEFQIVIINEWFSVLFLSIFLMLELSYTDIFLGDINMGDNAEYENYRRLEKISWNKVSLCVNF